MLTSKHAMSRNTCRAHAFSSSLTLVIECFDIRACCNRVIFDNFRKCGSVAVAASEEKPQELDMGGEVSHCHLTQRYYPEACESLLSTF
jgi:hypothetical protein